MTSHLERTTRAIWAACMLCSVPLSTAVAESVTLTDGIVVDTEQDRVYLMSPEQAVEAVSTGGETLWTSAAAAKPLLAQAGRLVAQAEAPGGALDIVALDPGQRGELVWSSSIPLPPRVTASISDSPTSRFSSRAVAVEGEAFVSWDHQSFPVRGVLPDPEEEGAAAAVLSAPPPTSSTVRLDLATGRTTPVPPASLPAVVRSPAGRAAAAAPDPTRRASADGRHTLVSERTGDDRVWEKYRWTIVDNATGEEVGSLDSHLSQAPFLVVESGLLLYETGPYTRRTESGLRQEPRALRAVDLASGEERWVRPVRDTAFRGAFPP